MPSLHDVGWRQGSVFDAELSVMVYVDLDGEYVAETRIYARWVVISQDCDLATAESDSNAPVIEVLPVVDGNPQTGWGLRGRRLRLDPDIHVDAELPKLRLSPSALSYFVGNGHRVIEDSRAIALKTWLGRRYDRPAVPEVLVDLGRAIGDAVKSTRTPALAEVTHDVLFAATEARPASFELIAVVDPTADAAAVEQWLTKAALLVDPALGTLASAPEALTKAEISLEVIENTYSANLSDITWKRADPNGAI